MLCCLRFFCHGTINKSKDTVAVNHNNIQLDTSNMGNRIVYWHFIV